MSSQMLPGILSLLNCIYAVALLVSSIFPIMGASRLIRWRRVRLPTTFMRWIYLTEAWGFAVAGLALCGLIVFALVTTNRCWALGSPSVGLCAPETFSLVTLDSLAVIVVLFAFACGAMIVRMIYQLRHEERERRQ